MSETSRRRRWFGRSLFAASALALPLTASISYASASAQPAPPEPPAAPSPAIAPLPPAPPEVPEARQAGDDNVHSFVQGHDGEPTAHYVAWSEPPEPPQPPEPPEPPQFHGQGDWDSEEFKAEMAEFEREMEKFAEEFNSEEWERYGEQMARWGEQHAAQVRAHADQVRRQMPDINRIVHSSLRSARAAIARDHELSQEERAEALREIDEEIERFDRESD